MGSLSRFPGVSFAVLCIQSAAAQPWVNVSELTLNISERAHPYCHRGEWVGWGTSATLPYPLSSPLFPSTATTKPMRRGASVFHHYLGRIET